MGRVAQLAAVLVCVVLVPTAAYAQASITGVVRDTSGAVLPGVTVEAASPALIEKVRSVVTDGTGQYRIENLRPGLYTVTFTLPGFANVRREGIELTGTFTATVNAELRVGAVEETITVTGETPVVDVQSTTQQRVIDREVMDALPTARTDHDLARVIPGITVGGGGGGSSTGQNVGGREDTANNSLSVHGLGDARVTVNGLTVHLPFGSGQTQSNVPNLAAMQEVTIDTSGVDAEMGMGGARVNYVLKDGGNTFSGMAFGNFANEAMQSNNITQELKDLGVRHATALKKLYDLNPGFGGPVKQDRLWFYAAVRRTGRQNYPAGISYNLNAGNPSAWAYVPDPSRRPFNDTPRWNETARLTWQASAKNKIGVVGMWDGVCYCSETIGATTAPEAAIFRPILQQRNVSADWTAPLTNRVLLEAAIFSRIERVVRNAPPGTNPSMVSVTDQGLGNLVYRAPTLAFAQGAQGNLRNTLYRTFRYRAAVSYITGAHAFKVGFNAGRASDRTTSAIGTLPFEYRFNNGVPNQITMYSHPLTIVFQDEEGGVYAQDKWTVGRLTLTYGLRYDFYSDNFPDQFLGPAPLVPNRNLLLPAADGISWHDVTPKSGAAYDLFGNGKTALKFALNKYVEGLGSSGTYGNALNPLGRLVLTTVRSWNDANRNFVPECDLLNPDAHGECGAMENRNFGSPLPGATYDRELLTGWSHRGYNWEFSTGVQHEILPRVSVDVSYFRRWFGNFKVTDNRTVSPSDYDPFNITAPTDPRLPGGGGYVISGLYDLKPDKFGRPADDYVTSASNYGKQTESWNGADVTVNARPRPGVLVQGGMSTGRRITDKCDIVAKLDNPSTLYCRVTEAFLTQVKFLGAYTIPRVDVQVSGTLQNVPGPQISANYAAPTAVVATSLGRPLAGGARNVTVNLVEPGTRYGERMNQVDLRVAKILRFGRTRTSVILDVFNAFNANPVLALNNIFGGNIPWQLPQTILNPRFVKVGAQVDF